MVFAPSTEREPNAEEMVDALNATFGRHPHRRASHAKGFCVTGNFIPSSAASVFSGSAIFQPGKHPAVVRFSIAGGNPYAADNAPAARGMAVDIDAGGGQGLTLVMISTPMFFAASGKSFVSFLEARRPDPGTGKPDPRKIEISNRIHLDSEAQRRWLSAVPPSASYATSPYFAVHTYLFETPNGTKQPGRWIFEPIAGRIGLSKDELQTKPDSFLAEELKQRLAIDQVEWRVLLQLPEATNPLLNPTVAWPGFTQDC